MRHSSEKNHIRWGLQAFDNLTLYDYDYENANGTTGSNETLFDFGTNQTFLGESFGYYLSDAYNKNTNASGGANTSNGDTRLLSTLAPYPSSSQSQTRWSASTSITPAKNQKLAKKQIMENIRKNVEEGIQYLRTHAHLSKPTAVMPSEKALLQLQKQAEQMAENQRAAAVEKDVQASPESVAFSSSASAQLSISKHFKSPSSDSFNQVRTEHNQSNQKKYKFDKLQSPSQSQWKAHKTGDTQHNGREEYGSKEIHFDYEMQKDEPINENVHQIENHPHKASKLNKSYPRHAYEPSSLDGKNKTIATMKTIDSIVTSINAAVSKKLLDQTINNGAKPNLNGNLNGNSNGIKANLRSQSNSSSRTTMRAQPSNQKQKDAQPTNADKPVSSVASLVSYAFDPESAKQNDSAQSNVKTDGNFNNQFDANGFLSPFDELNGEQQVNDDTGTDDTNPFAFDANYEQTIAFDGKTINSNDIVQPQIFRMEDIDLEDLDEISRNNRLNLKKGRDVVTKFLQIVESQHLLGANCTAGTALNLGEGVVDRYAQDRFRVEAEVAINRANMLTRLVKLRFFLLFCLLLCLAYQCHRRKSSACLLWIQYKRAELDTNFKFSLVLSSSFSLLFVYQIKINGIIDAGKSIRRERNQ